MSLLPFTSVQELLCTEGRFENFFFVIMRSRNWFLTINYDNDDEVFFFTRESLPAYVTYFIWTLERGDEAARLHCHAYVELNSTKSLNQILSIPNVPFWFV